MSVHLAAEFFRTIRRAEWSVLDAVFHLIDNALDAGARHVWVYVRPDAEPLEAVVEVIDDGSGMDAGGIRLALALGVGSADVSALGAFGLGLKAAAASLGTALTVVSSSGRSAPFARASVCIADVETSGRYTSSSEPLGVEDTVLLDGHLPNGRGTLVRTRGVALARPSIQAVLPLLQSAAAVTYGLLLGDGLSLQIGGVGVEAADPLRAAEADRAEEEGLDSAYRWMLRSRRLLLDSEAPVYGTYEVTKRTPLPDGSIRRLDRPEHDGLYVYRNRRLVASALRSSGFPTGADGGSLGFRGRLHVDGTADAALQLDLRKAVVELPDDAAASLYRVVVPKLRRVETPDA